MTIGPACRPALAAALSAVVLSGGAGRPQPGPVNPIVPSLRLNRTRVPLRSAVELTYSWALEPGATRLGQDYRAFVHFLDGRGRILFADDHQPEPQTSRWEPGKTYTYGRTLFVPVVSYTGPVEVRLGLHPYPGRGERPALKGEHRGMREYKVGVLELLPQTENIAIVYRQGWHDPEQDPENPGVERTWTKKEALVSFKNPRKSVIVYLEGETCAACFTSAPRLTLTVGGRVGLQSPVDAVLLKKVRVKAADLGAREWVNLRLSMSESFVPSKLTPPLSDDPRELGFDVFHLWVAEAADLGAVPGVVDAVPLAPTGEQ